MGSRTRRKKQGWNIFVFFRNFPYILTTKTPRNFQCVLYARTFPEKKNSGSFSEYDRKVKYPEFSQIAFGSCSENTRGTKITKHVHMVYHILASRQDAFPAPILAVYLQYGPKRDSWNNECKLRSLQNMKVEGDRGEEKENASKHNLYQIAFDMFYSIH